MLQLYRPLLAKTTVGLARVDVAGVPPGKDQLKVEAPTLLSRKSI